MQPPQTEVIPAPFDENSVELLWHDLLQKGNVLVQQLLLQADGVRGDDHATFLVGTSREDGGNEISEAFADSCTCFHHEMVFAGNGLGHRVGHGQLLRTRLIVAKLSSDGAVRTKNGSNGHTCHHAEKITNRDEETTSLDVLLFRLYQKQESGMCRPGMRMACHFPGSDVRAEKDLSRKN